jgi:hypothetical protein
MSMFVFTNMFAFLHLPAGTARLESVFEGSVLGILGVDER